MVGLPQLSYFPKVSISLLFGMNICLINLSGDLFSELGLKYFCFMRACVLSKLLHDVYDDHTF